MEIRLTRKFQKQIEDCKDQRVKMKVSDVIQAVIQSEHMKGFKNIKKLSGYKNSYRIRLGNYRMGIVIESNTVIFAAFDHRSDIYKYFP